MYSYQPEGAERSFHYACSDVTFVDVANFNEDTRCFNSTLENPELTVDEDHRVTTTDSDGNTPHTAETIASTKSGLGAGPIAGAVVGAVAGLGLIGAAVFFFRRRNAQKKKEQEQMQEVNEKAHSDTLSTRS
jgi:uncharacterized protein HemX